MLDSLFFFDQKKRGSPCPAPVISETYVLVVLELDAMMMQSGEAPYRPRESSVPCLSIKPLLTQLMTFGARPQRCADG